MRAFPFLDSAAAQGSATKSTPAPFTIFWMTDTQFLSETNPRLFARATTWIAKNWSAFNGKLLVHTGDIVQDALIPEEWSNADSAMDVLSDGQIPYVWCAGNHDLACDLPSSWIGNQYESFDPQTMKNLIGGLDGVKWVGDYDQGMNTAASLNVDGFPLLIVAVEWLAQDDTFDWLSDILEDPAYQDHKVIIATHAYENQAGSLDDPNWGSILGPSTKKLTSIMDAHASNVILTLNGHFPTEFGYHAPVPVNGRNQLMFDRQESTDDLYFGDDPPDALKPGGATITTLTFHLAANRLVVRTYDSYLDRFVNNLPDQYSIPLLRKAWDPAS